MSFADLNDVFSNEVANAEEAVAIDITPVTVIETPLFDIHFKTYEVGNTKVDSTKGFVSLNIFSLCDKLIVQIATEAISGRALIFGEQAVAENTAPNFLTVFNENGQLKEEQAKLMKASDVQRVEQLYASVKACYDTLQAMIAAHKRIFPLSRKGIQLAWNAEKTTGIYDVKEALTYRLQNNSKLRDIKRNVENRKSQQNGANILTYANFSDVLGF